MLKKNNIMRKFFVLLTALLLPLFAFEMNWEGYNMTILAGSAEYVGDSHSWIIDGARRTESNVFMVFAEWQPYDCGEFTQSYYSIDNPNVVSGTTSLFYHYNWGWGGLDDGWYAFNSNHYPYSRQNFFISKPN